MGQHRCQHAAGHPALQRTCRAEQDGGEAQHRVARRHHGDEVDRGGYQYRTAPAQRAVQRPAEEQFLGHPVDHGDEHDQQQRAVTGEFQYGGDVVAHRRDEPCDQAAHHEHRAQSQSDTDAEQHRAAPTARQPAHMQRTG